MPRFRFTLQPLLTQRERIEKDRQREVAVAETERMALEGKLRGLQESIQQEREVWRQALSPTEAGRTHAVDPRAARQQAVAIVAIEGQARRVSHELVQAHQRVAAARERLGQAAKDRRAMELLKERRFEEWRSGLQRAESAFLDEVAVQRAIRAGTNEALDPRLEQRRDAS